MSPMDADLYGAIVANRRVLLILAQLMTASGVISREALQDRLVAAAVEIVKSEHDPDIAALASTHLNCFAMVFDPSNRRPAR